MMRRWSCLLILLLPLLLSGCMFSASAESLYDLPALPEEYQTLSAQLNDILSGGAEYAAPQSGSNLPPVQMVDLDGDNSDEVLAFFRFSGEERPLRIYIFQAGEDAYEPVATIDGSGTAIQSVLYDDMDGDGVREIIVSWSVSAEVQSLSVYALEKPGPVPLNPPPSEPPDAGGKLEPVRLMSTPYARYSVADLDGDGQRELVVVRSDEAEGGTSLADYYDWDGGSSALSLRSTARLSSTVAALQGMQVGALQEGEAAIFVTGRDTGSDGVSRAVTDILVYREPDLLNIALSSDTGVSGLIARSLNLQPADINADGATEVPNPAELVPDGEEQYWKIYWYSYDAEGAGELQVITYHDQADGWYLLIPDAWDGYFAVRQNNTGSTVHSTTFYRVQGRSIQEELLTIYTLTGTNREALATSSGRVILRRRGDTIYAVSFSDKYLSWHRAISAEELADRFVPIINRWTTTDPTFS